VIGGLAAAVGLDDLDVCVLGDMELARFSPAPERDHGRVLEQHHGVGKRPLRNLAGQRALQLPGFEVRDLPEIQQAGGPHDSRTS